MPIAARCSAWLGGTGDSSREYMLDSIHFIDVFPNAREPQPCSQALRWQVVRANGQDKVLYSMLLMSPIHERQRRFASVALATMGLENRKAELDSTRPRRFEVFSTWQCMEANMANHFAGLKGHGPEKPGLQRWLQSQLIESNREHMVDVRPF